MGGESVTTLPPWPRLSGKSKPCYGGSAQKPNIEALRHVSILKAFNIEKESYRWSAEDVHHGSIPSEIKIVLCSGSAFNGNYAENLSNFKNCQLNFSEVMVDGVSIPSQAITPNYINGDFSEAYRTLMW